MRAPVPPDMAAESIMLGPAIAGGVPAQMLRAIRRSSRRLLIRITSTSLVPGLPLPAWLLLRQRGGESDPARNPRSERGLRSVSRRRHEQPAVHGPGPRKVEWLL